jgi:hypothetical protein
MSVDEPYAESKPRFRFEHGLLLVIVFVVCGLLAGYMWFHYRIVVPRRHADSVERLLQSLVDRRPADVTRGQWGSAVAWTLNLHANSLLPFEADGATIAAFERRLQAKLQGDVDMQTIDWIWAEYARLCPHGASYQRFKAMMQDEIDTVAPDADAWGMNVP